MSKNLLSIGFKFRNKGSMIVPKDNATEVEIVNNVFRKLDKWLKWNKLDFSPRFICPTYERRVLERPKPSYARLILKRERYRKRDREVIRSFCNYIIYQEGKHKPL